MYIYGISLNSSWSKNFFRKCFSINIFPESCFFNEIMWIKHEIHCHVFTAIMATRMHQKVTCKLNIRFHLGLGLPNDLLRSGFAKKLFSYLRNSRSVPHSMPVNYQEPAPILMEYLVRGQLL